MPAASEPGARASGPLWMLLGLASAVLVLWHAAVLAAAALTDTPGGLGVRDSMAAILASPGNPLAGYDRRIILNDGVA